MVSKLALFSVTLLLEVNLALLEDPLWYPNFQCRKGYKAKPFDVRKEQRKGGDYYKQKAAKCTGYEQDDPCLKFCVFKEMGVLYEEKDGVKINFLNTFLEDIYDDQRAANALAEHIMDQCDPYSTSERKWSCKTNPELIHCIERFMNCSWTIRDYLPFQIFNLSCHLASLFSFKQASQKARRNDGICKFENPKNDLCAMGCFLEFSNFGRIIEVFKKGKEKEALAHLAEELGELGFKPVIRNGVSRPSDYTNGYATKILRDCSRFYSSDMDNWFTARRNDKAESEGCDTPRAKWEKFVRCVGKILRCNRDWN